MKRTHGFTLIELMVSTAIAMFLASMCVTAFLGIRQLVRRAEARIAMYDTAQVLYTRLNQSTAQLMQHCALVARCDAGAVELTFMRGKEDHWDWKLWERKKVGSDLVWERWRWEKGATGGILYQASSHPVRGFVQSVAGGSQKYQVLPQPRRWLDPADPLATLNDNRFFRSTAVAGDMGDSTDLDNNLLPVLSQVSDLSIQLVNHDGSTDTLSTASSQTLVRQGVWMDGRVGDVLSATPTVAAYSASGIAKRPRLLRLRLTVTDRIADPRSDLVQTFSFSFALPGMAGAQ